MVQQVWYTKRGASGGVKYVEQLEGKKKRVQLTGRNRRAASRGRRGASCGRDRNGVLLMRRNRRDASV
jgi:hypothetical protein